MTGIGDDPQSLNAAADAAIEACGDDARAAVRALIVANSYLDAEVQRLAKAVSTGFARGSRAKGKELPVFVSGKSGRTFGTTLSAVFLISSIWCRPRTDSPRKSRIKWRASSSLSTENAISLSIYAVMSCVCATVLPASKPRRPFTRPLLAPP
jgi:hypothetical protein